jgi:hypothetical protein
MDNSVIVLGIISIFGESMSLKPVFFVPEITEISLNAPSFILFTFLFTVKNNSVFTVPAILSPSIH